MDTKHTLQSKLNCLQYSWSLIQNHVSDRWSKILTRFWLEYWFDDAMVFPPASETTSRAEWETTPQWGESVSSCRKPASCPLEVNSRPTHHLALFCPQQGPTSTPDALSAACPSRLTGMPQETLRPGENSALPAETCHWLTEKLCYSDRKIQRPKDVAARREWH